MRHSLRDHVLYLENTIRSVRDRLKKRRLSAAEVEDLDLQLTLAESALEHYRQAYALELSVSGPEPPGRPEAQSGGSSGDAEGENRAGKKEGLVLVAERKRKKARAGVIFAFPSSRNRMCA
jgi:hypothetical protein